MNQPINLRSDTQTLPTKEMMDAIMNAKLGDDVKHEDLSTIELQEYAADLMGKEAALLVTSGTMGNIISVMCHTWSRKSEMICEENVHIITSEGGNYAHLGGVAVRSVKGNQGAMDPQDVLNFFRDRTNIHHPRTALVCMENTHNFAGGTVISMENMKAVRDAATQMGAKMHLDGARVFNAAIKLGVPAKKIADNFDSVQFCLSKGLSAPVGSLIVGSRAFIEDAEHIRKMLGGGLRQSGIIAAPGLVALKTMVNRLADDHETAYLIAQGIKDIDGIELDMSTVQTNMVKFGVAGLGVDGHDFCDVIAKYGVLCGTSGTNYVRYVTSRHVSKEDTAKVIEATKKAVAEITKK